MVRWLRCTIRAGKPAICTKTEPDDDESAPPLALERFRVWPAVVISS